jgi:hypothetical protein
MRASNSFWNGHFPRLSSPAKRQRGERPSRRHLPIKSHCGERYRKTAAPDSARRPLQGLRNGHDPRKCVSRRTYDRKVGRPGSPRVAPDPLRVAPDPLRAAQSSDKAPQDDICEEGGGRHASMTPLTSRRGPARANGRHNVPWRPAVSVAGGRRRRWGPAAPQRPAAGRRRAPPGCASSGMPPGTALRIEFGASGARPGSAGRRASTARGRGGAPAGSRSGPASLPSSIAPPRAAFRTESGPSRR